MRQPAELLLDNLKPVGLDSLTTKKVRDFFHVSTYITRVIDSFFVPDKLQIVCYQNCNSNTNRKGRSRKSKGNRILLMHAYTIYLKERENALGKRIFWKKGFRKGNCLLWKSH